MKCSFTITVYNYLILFTYNTLPVSLGYKHELIKGSSFHWLVLFYPRASLRTLKAQASRSRAPAEHTMTPG